MNTFKVLEKGLLLETLFGAFKTVKKTTLRQCLKFGSVLVNGQPVTRRDHSVSPGDTILIRRDKPAPVPKAAPGRPLLWAVLYEDDDLMVVDKSAGLLTIATETEKINTLYYQLNEYLKSKKQRVFIVHRLDRDTSGLLVFAKKEAAKRALQDHWENTEKKYLALAEGKPVKASDTIESYLSENKFHHVFSGKPHDYAHHAITHYKLLRSNRRYSLLEITLETGRKNQIRVHLSDIGHPVVGDKKYGNPAAWRGGSLSNPIRRLGLHAHHLSFDHPTTGKRLTFSSEIPESFLKTIA